MIAGSCLCGTVRFRIASPLFAPRYCHCTNCTKFSGTTPAAWAMADASTVEYLTPNARVTAYVSGRGRRSFCATCGSPVWFEPLAASGVVAIPLGALDDGVVPPPTMRLWVRSNPEWCAITDDLPRHDTDPVK